MVKIVSMMNRRADLSMAEFRSYYETRHVPLILSLLPAALDYRRNYTVSAHRTAHGAPRPVGRAFDVLTELTYEDETYRRVVSALADPAIGERIAADEARFLDRASMRSYVVEECR